MQNKTYKRYTDDEKLINALKIKAEKLGRTPSMKEINDDKAMANIPTYYRHFGSWKKVLALAGLEHRRQIAYSDEELLNILREFAKKIGNTPSKNDFDKYGLDLPASNTYAKRFGGWNKALEKAGIPTIYVGRLGSGARQKRQERILTILREFYRIHRRIPVINDFIHAGNYGINGKTILVYFGSWEKAIEAAGLGKIQPLWKTILSAIGQWCIERGR